MSPDPSGRILLRLPPTLHAHLIDEADREGMSVNAFIVAALAGAVAWRATPAGERVPPGKILRALRRQRGWSQAETARALDVSPRVYHRWEHDPDVRLGPDAVERIVAGFGPEAMTALGRGELPPPPPELAP